VAVVRCPLPVVLLTVVGVVMVVDVVSGGQVDSKTSISQMLKTSSRLVIEFLAEIVLLKNIKNNSNMSVGLNEDCKFR
jgi:hypothetical protein